MKPFDYTPDWRWCHWRRTAGVYELGEYFYFTRDMAREALTTALKQAGWHVGAREWRITPLR